ncbi:hypothetical protein ACROYT_G035120 [Oculina patagonica]
MVQTVKQANKKDSVEAEILNHLFDINEWIDDYIPDLHGHLKSYQFKIEAVGEGATFAYRKRAASTEWTLVDQTKYQIFKELPVGIPSMVESTFVEMKVPLFVRHLRSSYFKWMSEDCVKEWEAWIVKTEQEIDGQTTKVDKAEWSNRPLIGKVQSIGADTVQIHWLDGSYNGNFRDSFLGSGANRHSWTEDITKNQIIMIGVQFTNSRRLQEDIEELRARYQMIDEENDRNSDES